MFTERQLNMLREGKIPLSFNDNGMPSQAANAPIFELMLFIRALAAGYTHLFNRVRFLEKCANAKFSRKENAS